jgi:hypothetical protein
MSTVTMGFKFKDEGIKNFYFCCPADSFPWVQWFWKDSEDWLERHK